MNSLPSADNLVKLLGLQPHPEGGFFKETYRSEEHVDKGALPGRYRGDRVFSTAIYFLLPRGTKSRLHRIASDEVWHFYLGGPLVVAEIHADGTTKKTILGTSLDKGELVQHVVKAGTWFGAYPWEGTEYSLVGCTVAPGFDFADFEMGKRDDLLRQYPHAQALIESLTDP